MYLSSAGELFTVSSASCRAHVAAQPLSVPSVPPPSPRPYWGLGACFFTSWWEKNSSPAQLHQLALVITALSVCCCTHNQLHSCTSICGKSLCICYLHVRTNKGKNTQRNTAAGGAVASGTNGSSGGIAGLQADQCQLL